MNWICILLNGTRFSIAILQPSNFIKKRGVFLKPETLVGVLYYLPFPVSHDFSFWLCIILSSLSLSPFSVFEVSSSPSAVAGSDIPIIFPTYTNKSHLDIGYSLWKEGKKIFRVHSRHVQLGESAFRSFFLLHSIFFLSLITFRSRPAAESFFCVKYTMFLSWVLLLLFCPIFFPSLTFRKVYSELCVPTRLNGLDRVILFLPNDCWPTYHSLPCETLAGGNVAS